MEEEKVIFTGTSKHHKDYLEGVVYQDHLKELEYQYNDILSVLEESSDPAEIYRAQGALRLIKLMMGLAESVYEQIKYNEEQEREYGTIN